MASGRFDTVAYVDTNRRSANADRGSSRSSGWVSGGTIVVAGPCRPTPIRVTPKSGSSCRRSHSR
jgi:hypothetical protein